MTAINDARARRSIPYNVARIQQSVRELRAHEYAERQKVSLLEIEGLGWATLIKLWRNEIRTADDFLATDNAALVRVVYGEVAPRKQKRMEQKLESLKIEIRARIDARPRSTREPRFTGDQA